MRIAVERPNLDRNRPQSGLFSAIPAPENTASTALSENTNAHLLLSIKAEPLGKPARISGKARPQTSSHWKTNTGAITCTLSFRKEFSMDGPKRSICGIWLPKPETMNSN